jgi:general secretion pathway protein E
LGYRGRTGIYELVKIDDAMRAMIYDGLGEHELERKAREDSPGIRQDGWDKVLNGVTSVEEVLRVTRGD